MSHKRFFTKEKFFADLQNQFVTPKSSPFETLRNAIRNRLPRRISGNKAPSTQIKR